VVAEGHEACGVLTCCELLLLALDPFADAITGNLLEIADVDSHLSVQVGERLLPQLSDACFSFLVCYFYPSSCPTMLCGFEIFVIRSIVLRVPITHL
jgi:hypothetical protein